MAGKELGANWLVFDLSRPDAWTGQLPPDGQTASQGEFRSCWAWSSEVDDVVADVGAGIDRIGASGMVPRLQYDGRFGKIAEPDDGTAEISVPF